MEALSRLLLVILVTTTTVANEAQIGADGSASSNAQLDVVFTNLSPRRADLYWDDGHNGQLNGVVESGASVRVNTFDGHGFFWTRHGASTPMCDDAGDRVQHVMSIRDGTTDFALPADAVTQSGCYDRYTGCGKMKGYGACDTSPGWMIMHCPVTCDACALTDPAVRCPRENLEMDPEPTWAPGDLNTMFERIMTSPEFARLDPVVLSSPSTPRGGDESPPWVVRFDSFITPEETAALIGEVNGQFARSTDVGETDALGEAQKVVSTGRTSENAWCGPECMANAHVRNVSKRIFDVTGVPRSHYESFQVLKYGQGQKYNTHHDNGGDEMALPCGPRILTFFVYLSDVEEGGTTDFTKLDLSVKPKVGRAVLWPSVLDSDPTEVDWRTMHRASPVIRGTKFAVRFE